MPEFAYTAYTAPGLRQAGRLIADSEGAVAERLLSRGLQPVEIRPIGRAHRALLDPFRRKLGNRDRALLAVQLSDLLNCGMPVLEALALMEAQADSPAVKRTLSRMQVAIRQGGSLADAMDSCRDTFAPLHGNLIRAGEGSGLLTLVLSHMADLEERELELKTKIRAALLYPSITLCVGMVTILVILNFVIPRLSSIFDEMGQDLPLVTRILLGMSGAAQWAWRYGLLILLPAIVAGLLLLRSLPWRRFRDRSLLRLPKLGGLLQDIQVARFARILASLLHNGVPMVPALRATVETLDNQEIAAKVREAAGRVQEGTSLAAALERERALPRRVSGLIAVGERTGNLESTLDRIGDSTAREVERRIRILVSMVEPALIIGLGLFVAFIVAAVILPIMRVNLAFCSAADLAGQAGQLTG